MGLATTVNIKQYIMPNTKLQSFLDTYVQSKPELNGIVPTEYCTINRNPSGTESPWAAVSAPTSGQLVSGGNVNVQFNAYTPNAGAGVASVKVYLDNSSSPLLTATTLPYSGSVSIGSIGGGMHNLRFVVEDTLGNDGTTTIPIEVLGSISISSTSNLNNISPSQEVTISYSYSVSGLALEGVSLYMDGTKVGTCVSGNSGTCMFTAPDVPGNYTLYVTGNRQGQSIKSNEEPMRVRP